MFSFAKLFFFITVKEKRNGALAKLTMQEDGQTESTMVTYTGPFDHTTSEPFIKRTTGNNIETDIYFDPVTQMPTALKTHRLPSHAEYIAGERAKYQNLTYTYDIAGNITKITDANDPSATETYTYDKISRLKSAQSGHYGNMAYQYSMGGNLTQKGDAAKPLILTYDRSCPSFGATTVSAQAVCSSTDGVKTTRYKYDANGNMTFRGDPGGIYRDLIYDNEDRLARVMGQTAGTTTYFGYDHSGQRTAKVSPDNTVVYYIGGLYEVMFTPDGSQVHTKYVYGAEGDLIAQKTDTNTTITMLGQNTLLAQAGVFDFTSVQAFGDSVYAAGLWVWQEGGAVIANYLATHQTPVAVWLLVVFGFVMVVVYVIHNYKIIYRAAHVRHLQPIRDITGGQVGTGGGAAVQIAYTNPRRKGMAEISSILLLGFSSLFVFNCFNMPISPSFGPGAAYDPAASPEIANPLGMYNNSVANARPTPGLLFFHPNHLGSTALMTDVDGVAQTTIHYKPYGEVIRDNEPDPKLAASSGPDAFRHKYTAQEEDPETSLMYYNARYYDPAIGRFVSADSIIPDIGSQGHNRYMYVGGNPISYSDPSGHEPFLIGLLITMAIGGTISTASYAIQNGGCTFGECLGAFIQGAVISGMTYLATAGIGMALGGEGFLGSQGAGRWGIVNRNEILHWEYLEPGKLMNDVILNNAYVSGAGGGLASMISTPSRPPGVADPADYPMLAQAAPSTGTSKSKKLDPSVPRNYSDSELTWEIFKLNFVDIFDESMFVDIYDGFPTDLSDSDILKGREIARDYAPVRTVTEIIYAVALVGKGKNGKFRLTPKMRQTAKTMASGKRIDVVKRLVQRYGGRANDWKKRKAVDEQGREWHWYELNGQRFEEKIKRWVK